VRIFRAGKNFYRLRLLRWAVAQIGGVLGIIFSLTFLIWFREEIRIAREYSPPAETLPVKPAGATTTTVSPTAPRDGQRTARRRDVRRDLSRLAQRTPDWTLVLIEVIEVGGILLFLVQLPLTAVATRLEYELHWYIVTDRSLRIRTGLLRLQESTMSFANLQQVEVQQGPLQRLLGLSDLRVQSAGGGSAPTEKGGERDSLHTGVFHGVENAGEIRDLILERLRKFRESGIGDPDDHHSERLHAAPLSGDSTVLAAAHELLAEARALREQTAVMR
jgi:hypothetical protein